MLQFIRGTVGSWLVKILFVLLIASFAVWGIGDIFRGQGPETTVAEVGPFEISALEVERELQRQIGRLQQTLGPEFTLEQARLLGLPQQSLEQLIQRALFELAVRDAGLEVGTSLVQQRMQAQGGFVDPTTGRFNADLFRRFLLSNGLTEEGYVAFMREQIGRELISSAVAAGARAPDRLVRDLYRHQAEGRVADIIFVAADRFTDLPEAAPNALAEYHANHSVQFTAPELRTLSLVMVRPQDFAADIDVPTETLRAEFEARIDEFVEPERRTVTQVVVESEDEARRIIVAAEGGGDLAAVAGAEPITFDLAAEDDLPDIGATAFGLAAGELGGPVQSAFGWHVIRVDAIQAGGEAGFDDVRDEVLARVQTDLAVDRIYDVANELDDLLAGGAGLGDAAQELGLTVSRIDAVDAEGNRSDGTPVEGIADLGTVLDTALGLAAGEQSLVTETNAGDFFVVRVDGIEPSRLRPLEEVGDQVRAGWQAQQRLAQADALAEELAQRLETGADAETLAAEHGLDVLRTEAFTRDADTAAQNLPPGLRRGLFAEVVGGVVQGPVGEVGHTVARLVAVEPADPDAAETVLRRLEATATQQVATDLLAQFVAGLRGSHDVAVYPERMQDEF